MHSTSYIIRFVLIMTTVSALILALLSTVLADKHIANEKIYNKRAILASVKDYIGGGTAFEDLTDKQVEDLFTKNIQSFVLNMEGNIVESMDAEKVDLAKEKKKPESERLLPVYVFKNDKGESFHILSIRGNGLWDEIWGNIAMREDLTTIAGASFDHKGETPGLGAEIKDNPAFPAQFNGKMIFNDKGDYTSVVVRKGGAVNKTFEVDGISGATVTCDGVSEMLYRGIKYYSPYLNSQKEKE